MDKEQRELREYMEANFQEFVEITLTNAIEAIKKNPDYFRYVNHLYPFNKKEFAEVDWTKVSHATIENHHKLVLTMIEDE